MNVIIPEGDLSETRRVLEMLRQIVGGFDVSLALTDTPCSPRRGWVTLRTSGTTGTPKCVERDVYAAYRAKRGGMPGEKWLLTYSPWRWAGISVMLHVLAFDGELIVPRSLAPGDVLEAARGATHVSLTPSMFRLIGSRLPKMAQITFGGEAVSQALLDAARAKRVTHTYASSEIGDICSVSDRKAGFPAEKFASFWFLDGELVVNGYQTGDLWELRDGRYYFAGRTSDIVNVGGANVSLHAIEQAALAMDGVTLARARTVESPILGQVVVLDYEGTACPSDFRHLKVIARRRAIELRNGKT